MNNDKVSLSRYILVILCVSIVFTALVLIILNSWVQNKRLSDGGLGIPAIDQVLFGQSFEDGYKAGYLAARSKYQTMVPMPEGAAIQNLNGQIQSIGSDQLVVMADNLDVDEIVDGVSSKRTVLIASTTKILFRQGLPPEEHMRQIEEWNKNRTTDLPPISYIEKSLALKDLSEGQAVSVTAAEDIRLLTSFYATEIVLYKAPESNIAPLAEPAGTVTTTVVE